MDGDEKIKGGHDLGQRSVSWPYQRCRGGEYIYGHICIYVYTHIYIN